MVFISFIIVFNVSIILLMTITFSNAAFTIWPKSLKLYQLPALNNPNYDDYLKKEMDTKKEKKLDIFQFFAAAHNFETWVYGFKRDGNKDLFEKLYWDNCKSDYRDPIYAINQYFINKFKTTIEDLRKCTNPDKYNETDYQESVILKDVHRALNSLSISQKNLLSQKKEKFKALDKVLDDDEKCRIFYRCFQKFKNDVKKIKIENANYPKQLIQLEIDADKVLTQKEKEKILQDKDLTFLKENQIYKNEEENMPILKLDMTKSKYFNMLKNYTGYSERERECTDNFSEECESYSEKKWANNISKECEDQFLKLTSVNWFIHYTAIFENLKIIMDNDDFALMKSCRALFEENNYKFYVMRLIQNECMPLARTEWGEEKSAINENYIKKLKKQNEEMRNKSINDIINQIKPLYLM